MLANLIKKVRLALNSLIKSRLIFIPLIVLVAVVLYRFKGIAVAATVNGKSVLDSLVTNQLIRQEAQKQKIVVTPEQVSTQIDQITKNLETQGQTLDSALQGQGMTRKDLDDQIKLQIMVQQMAGKGIEVTDKEIEDYFTQNKDSYPKGTTLDSVKDQIKSSLTQQKTSQAITTWLSELKTKAKINYFVSY